MRKMFSVLVLTAAIFVGLGSMAGPAVAAPLHQHELQTPSGPVKIALGFCENPQLFGVGQRNHFVFDHFHGWIHVGSVVPTTVTSTSC